MAKLPTGLSYGPGGTVSGSYTTTTDPYYKQRQIHKLAQVAQMMAGIKKEKEAKLYEQINMLLEDPSVDPDLAKNSEAMRKLRKANKAAHESFTAMFDAKKDEYDIRNRQLTAQKRWFSALEAQPNYRQLPFNPPGPGGTPLPGPLPDLNMPIPREEQYANAARSLSPADYFANSMFLQSQGTSMEEQGMQPPLIFNNEKLPADAYAVDAAQRNWTSPEVGEIGMIKGGLVPSVGQEAEQARFDLTLPVDKRKVAVSERKVAVQERKARLGPGPAEGEKVESLKVVPATLTREFTRVIKSFEGVDADKERRVRLLKGESLKLINVLIEEGMTRQQAIDKLVAVMNLIILEEPPVAAPVPR